MKLFRADVFINDENTAEWVFVLRAPDLNVANDLALAEADGLYPGGVRLPGEKFRVQVFEYVDKTEAGVLEECNWLITGRVK